MLGLATQDVTAQAKSLRDRGASVLFDKPQKFPVGVFYVVRDPSGNYIELLEFRQGCWQVAGNSDLRSVSSTDAPIAMAVASAILANLARTVQGRAPGCGAISHCC